MTENRLWWAACVLLGFGLWLSATPYMGVDHDARLYVLMALRYLNPAAYASDPWFAWGSQDDWSLYSPLLASVLTQLGVAPGALLMTMLQGVLYVLAAASFCRAWLRGPSALLAFLLLVSVPLFYSPRGMLSVSEGFVTARGLAVPLSLLALSCLRSRPWLAVLLHLAALAMHPIMGLGPALASLLLYPSRRVAFGLVAAGVLVVSLVFAAGGLGWLPLLDGDWYAYVEPAVLVFIGPWLQEEASRLVLILVSLLLAARFGTRATRPLYIVALAVGTGGLLVSLLASQVPVLIVLQAQLWRTFWLCLVVAVVALADLSARHVIRRGAPWRWLWLLLTGAFLLLSYFAGQLLALGAVLAGGALLSRPSLHRYGARLAALLATRRIWVAAFLLALSALLLPSFILSLELAATTVTAASGWLLPVEGLFRSGGFGLLALVAFLLLRRWKKLAPVCLLIPVAVFVANYWDVRSAVQRDQEARYSVDGSLNPVAQWIKRGEVVYWHQQPERVWMQLGTAGYASTTHCTGLVFSRQRTRQLSERMLAVAARSMERTDFEMADAQGTLRVRALTAARPQSPARAEVLASYEARADATPFGLQQMCRDASLKWVIDPLRVEGAYVASFGERLGNVRSQLYLYDCATFRAG